MKTDGGNGGGRRPDGVAAMGRADGDEVEIRLAGPDDLDSAIGLLRRRLPGHRRGGTSIGIATNRIEPALGGDGPSLIEHLCVLPDARRHGVASALLAAALEWSRERCCCSVFVTFRREDDETHALTDFYARREFEVVGATILARRLS